MLYVLCRPHNKRYILFIYTYTSRLTKSYTSYIARRKFAEEIYEIKNQPESNTAVATHSSESTVENDSAQNSNLEPVIASGVPLQINK